MLVEAQLEHIHTGDKVTPIAPSAPSHILFQSRVHPTLNIATHRTYPPSGAFSLSIIWISHSIRIKLKRRGENDHNKTTQRSTSNTSQASHRKLYTATPRRKIEKTSISFIPFDHQDKTRQAKATSLPSSSNEKEEVTAKPQSHIDLTTMLQAPQVAAAAGAAASSNKAPMIDETTLSKLQFPWKLHNLLDYAIRNNEEYIISWLPNDGRAFKIHNRDEFCSKYMKLFFKSTNYKSFHRNLNLWGFETVRQGRNKGYIYHPCFIRNEPERCYMMKRIKLKDTTLPTPPPASASSGHAGHAAAPSSPAATAAASLLPPPFSIAAAAAAQQHQHQSLPTILSPSGGGVPPTTNPSMSSVLEQAMRDVLFQKVQQQQAAAQQQKQQEEAAKAAATATAASMLIAAQLRLRLQQQQEQSQQQPSQNQLQQQQQQNAFVNALAAAAAAGQQVGPPPQANNATTNSVPSSDLANLAIASALNVLYPQQNRAGGR